jgi:PmbA protein
LKGTTVQGKQKTIELMKDILRRSGAEQTEVIVMGTDEQLTRFANNEIHQNVSETNVTITVRVAQGKRVGIATTNDLSPDGLDRVVQMAQDVVTVQPENPNFPGFPDAPEADAISAFDDATAKYSPEGRARAVGVICQRAQQAGLNAAGAFSTAINELGVANSLGVLAYHAGTVADIVTVVMSEDSSGYASERAWQVGRLDIAAMGSEAVNKALKSQNPRDLEPGTYAVVLEPYASQDLLQMLGFTGMGALAYQEGRSWMNDRLDQQVMAPSISIWDDGLDTAGIPMPFDFEGAPKQHVDIIRRGIAVGPVYDTATAREEENRTSTGHAVPPAMAATYGPMALNLFMAPGDATLEDMVASTERGILITRFHYTRPVHPRDAVITGLTRDGTFLILDGEIAYPIKNLRYTQSYLSALAGTEMVGKNLKTLGSYIGAERVPALKMGEFRFTGATQF